MMNKEKGVGSIKFQSVFLAMVVCREREREQRTENREQYGLSSIAHDRLQNNPREECLSV